MILQRSRPPLLETPFDVFDKGVFTPNDQLFVRWHWANIPGEADADTFRPVNRTLSLSLPEILTMTTLLAKRGERLFLLRQEKTGALLDLPVQRKLEP
jgi:hypothetical protein